MKLEKAKWDSDFFGYPVAKVTLNESENFDLEEFEEMARNYRLTYIFCGALNVVGFTSRFRHVDTKMVFVKHVEALHPENFDITDYRNSDNNFTQLLDLVFKSGLYSRFKTDKNFVNNEFERLYKEWICKSIRNKSSHRVLVKMLNDSICGFITLAFNREAFAEIGLIAVAERFRGEGIGRQLIKCAENVSIESKYKELQVVTQEKNIPACNFYVNNGYSLKRKIYVYHYWNFYSLIGKE